jgi:hypothetical protein
MSTTTNPPQPAPEPSLSVEALEKLSKEELRKKANAYFAQLATCGHEQEPAVLAKAQFYLRQLEHRWDSWISTRDLILEIIVILLIGGEIYMGIRQERQQQSNFKAEQGVLTNMLVSSQKTADTLTDLQATTKVMSDSLQKELGLFYDVSLSIRYDIATKQLLFTNKGRTNLILWGLGSDFLGIPPIIIEKEGRVIAPSTEYFLGMPEIYSDISRRFQAGATGFVPFEAYVKNEKGEEFVAHFKIGVYWENETMKLGTQVVSISPEHWSLKYHPIH